jgi:hypothetical protein
MQIGACNQPRNYNETIMTTHEENASSQAKRPLRPGTPLPLRKGIERLNRKYAKTLEKLAK